MNKGAIQRFAIWARNELIERVQQRAYQYGITKDSIGDPNATTIGDYALTMDEQRQRRELVRQIQRKNYTQVMEEVAYTWFNRFIALRFMEVNNYLPSHVRVFSDGNGAFKPEILNDALHLELPGLDADKVVDYVETNQTEDLYRYLLLTQCNALSGALPRMFERMGGYTEILLPNNILKPDGILGRLVTDIPEEDWKDAVQIIGWLYQYYNAELKDDTFALLKKNVKITKERIPSATQLFTPDWIVRYMVENSLGRIYINEQCALDGAQLTEPARMAKEKELADGMGWKYYLPEAEQAPEVRAQLNKLTSANCPLTAIKLIDPCMGSGHILVYAFDVLMDMYTRSGWNERDAAQSILQNNLYGLDIDDRAAQLAYFAVMMKARQYDRRFFTRNVQPHVYAIVESNGLDNDTVDYFTNNNPQLKKDFATLRRELLDAKEYGSILNITQVDFSALYDRIDEIQDSSSLFRELVLSSILPLIQVAEAMAQKYDVVVTNPPYMGSSGMSTKLSEFVKKNYPDSKSDLFAVFIERCGQMAKKNGYQAMITQHAWMFLSSFEKLRTKLLAVDIVNMAHLGARAFEEIGGEVVQTTSFVIRKSHTNAYKGEYCRLIEPTTQQGKEDMFLAGENRYAADQSNFSKIPGSPLASYYASKAVFESFSSGKNVSDIATPASGTSTGDNDTYLRLWHEVAFQKINFHALNGKVADGKWFPCNKGGAYRRWAGGSEYIIDWENDGERIRNCPRAFLRNVGSIFLPGLTWSKLGSGAFSIRQFGSGFICESIGCGLFAKNEDLRLILALLNGKVGAKLLPIINPTMGRQPGYIGAVPFLMIDNIRDEIILLVDECVECATTDWNIAECSWDFKRHPLV